MLPKKISDATPLECVRKIEKKHAIDRPVPGRSPFYRGRGENGDPLIQIVIVFSAAIREPAERINARRDQSIQDWDDLAPDSISQITRLEIAGVLAKRQSCRAKIRQDFLPLGVIERPNNLVIAECRHAGKTRQSRTTEHPQQDRFRLIVRRMAYGDTIGSALLGNLLHHTIAEVTGFSLQRGFAPIDMQSNPSNMERHSELSAKGLHKLLVPFGLISPQSVVAMNGR